jgi:hypothetical protein
MSGASTSSPVRLFAPFDPLYGSYWIDGLRSIGTIRLYPLPAQLLPSSIAFEFAERKFVIDAWDKSIVNEWWWKWSDVYGKVNLSLDTTISKVVPIGPGFATKAWGIVSIASALMRSAGWGEKRSSLDYAGGFLRQWYRRLPLTALVPGPSDPSYVFALHHYWPGEPDVNELRARFMRMTKASDQVQFEGGFVFSDHGQMSGHDDLLHRRVSYRRWLQQTRCSAAVLNTPGVSGCLGWKLGEYLALGKAIISTPIERRLPADLEHGTHIHIVDGSEDSMREAIQRITRDGRYRLRLEINSRAYFDRYVDPRAAIQRLVSCS